jgi:hypothetical protein
LPHRGEVARGQPGAIQNTQADRRSSESVSANRDHEFCRVLTQVIARVARVIEIRLVFNYM